MKAFDDLENTKTVRMFLDTYVRHLYGAGTIKIVLQRKLNDIRFTLFNRQYFLKKKMKNFDASTLLLSQPNYTGCPG